MSHSIRVLPREREFEAFQIVEDQTTPEQLDEFCGGPTAVSAGASEKDRTDLRWLEVNTPSGWVKPAFGDWILKDGQGNLSVVECDAFSYLYRHADEEHARTIDVRAAHSPEARLVRSFARSIRT